MVVPGMEADARSMPFCRRQIASLELAGVKITRFYLTTRTHPVKLVAEARKLRALARYVRPDLAHAHFGTVTGLLTTTALRGIAPIVITYRGSDLNPLYLSLRRNLRERYLRHLVGRWMSQLSAILADGIICVSEQLRGRLWSERARSRAVVIPTGVPIALSLPIEQGEARRRLGLDMRSKIVLVSGGRQPTIKRLDLAVDAVGRARALDPSITMVNLDGTHSFEQVQLHFSAADCFLMTSDFEGSPNIVKEALACNVPIVSVSVGDVPERIRDVTPSFLVARDPEAIAAGILAAVGVASRPNSRAPILRELAEPAIATRIITYYHDVMAGRVTQGIHAP
jgi:glycosyltransferase involved in cell wall biosynthesis